MAADAASDAPAPSVWSGITIRNLTPDDLRIALRQGFEDFRAKPSHVFFLTALYPILGVILTTVAFGGGALELIFPLVAGFALIGPLSAVGLYELSRRRENGEQPEWTDAFAAIRGAAASNVMIMAAVLLGIFGAWIVVAQGMWVAIIGADQPETLGALLSRALTTRDGLTLIVLGHLVGAVFAAVAMAVSVFSLPMLMDGERSVTRAVAVSIRACLQNPRTMLLWGLTVGVIMAVASIPALVGLAIALPVLGHATWRLYRRAIAR